jgi:hypothetical protein
LVVAEGLDPVEVTLDHLTSGFDLPRGLIALLDDSTLVPHDHVAERCRGLEQRANAVLEQLIPDAPTLTVEICHPADWLGGAPPIIWWAHDPPTLRRVRLSSLSGFQYRWAVFSIGLATQSASPLRQTFLVVDEPERAAHPIVIDQLVTGLRGLGRDFGAVVVVASHARELLSDPSFTLLHVRRRETGYATARELAGPLQADLAQACRELDLAPPDLLQLVRVFLLVEGDHDVAVIDEVMGDALRAARVHVLPMRGTKNLLGLLDAQFLASFSDARLVVALDRTNAGKARRAWDNARQAAALSIHDPARGPRLDAALRPLARGSAEEQVLAELLRATLRSNLSDRVAVHGFSKPDIIEYLPVQDFIPGTGSWQEAKATWPKDMTFKDWLRSLGVRVTTANLRKSASHLDMLPEDFRKLLAACGEAQGIMD